MVQTSSPPFYILKSLDDARAFMESRGRDKLDDLIQMLASVRMKMQAFGYADAHAHWENLPLSFDPTRLVIDAPQGGYALAEGLRAQGIDVEMADERRAVCIFSVMDGEPMAARLLDGLHQCAGAPAHIAATLYLPDALLPARRMMPRQAALGDIQAVSLEKAVGRIAAASVGLYPPGIPLVTPGEEISLAVVDALLSAPAEIRFGLADGQILCVTE